MKFVSFNINGLRARPHQLEAIVEQHQPDVIGLQETALESSHALAHALKMMKDNPEKEQLLVVNLSGRVTKRWALRRSACSAACRA